MQAPSNRILASLTAAPIAICLAVTPTLAQPGPGNATPAAASPAAAVSPAPYYSPVYYPAGAPAPRASDYPAPPASPPAQLGPPTNPSSSRKPHQRDGLYVRAAVGLDYLHASDGRLGPTETIAGLGPAIDSALGIAVVPNLILLANLVLTSAIDPTHTYGGKSETLSNTEMNLYGLGIGLAYYVEPLNLHVSGTVSLSWLTLEDTSNASQGSSDFTDLGFGASFAAGKEWWVSSEWGLGATTMFRYASLALKDYPARLTAIGVSLLFTATYN